MKPLTYILPLALLTTAPLTSFASADIEFHIQGVKQGEGRLLVQLFKGKENYTKDNALVGTSVQANSKTVVVKFNNIEQGEYALRFFHDENNNGQMETNLFGMPSEGYGFSNDAKPDFGPVSYSQIALTVSAQDSTVINKTHVIY
ncbi:MAG: DUF2141 domain-containing protein [Paraglaciecola sp.]|uniref:DUF2141 domain-containing protein n=1 Tax=Paraglaciecola sp. TaxID=1920173 RepID=UPI0032984AE8